MNPTHGYFLDSLLRHEQQRPESPALKLTDQGQYPTWTWGQVVERVRALAAHLQSLDIGRGHRVALFAANGPQWLIGYFGIHASGATVVPLDVQYSLRELEVLLPFANVSLVLVDEEREAILQSAEAADLKLQLLPLTGESTVSVTNLPASSLPLAVRNDEDEMSLIFTSGTTGDPKGVVLTDGNFRGNVEGIEQLKLVSSSDVLLSILPLHHCFAFTTTILLPVHYGCPVTFQPSLKGPDILAAIRDTGVTMSAGVPQLFATMEKNIMGRTQKLPPLQKRVFRLLFSLSTFLLNRFNVYAGRRLFRQVHEPFGSTFRFFVSGGARLDPEILQNLSILGIRVVEGYGLTETAPVVTMTPPDHVKSGSCGKALPGVEIKVDQPDGEGTGEIILRGPNVMKGYFQRPEDTAKVIKDGWFHTGDLGRIDEDGYLFITGRAKEVIVLSSGKNIYPGEVEKHYGESPFVAEMCVMGATGSDGKVEKLRAVVVPNWRLLRERNVANCTHHIRCDFEERGLLIPSYMRITDIRIVSDELPRTRLGKLKRMEIARQSYFDQEDDAAESRPALSEADAERFRQPLVAGFLERLSELTGRKEFLPADHLELDLGIDSLLRLELLVILEKEFSIQISKEEAADLQRLDDIIVRVETEGQQGETSGAGLLTAIRENPDPAFEKIYSLRPGLLENILKFMVRKYLVWQFHRRYKLQIIGAEKIPSQGAFLICPNHTSFLDPLLVFIALPRRQQVRTFFIALQEMFGGILMGPLVSLARIITTGTEDSLVRSLQYAHRALGGNCPLCIFPEGQRTVDENLVRPRKGFALLALEHNLPVYPVYIHGAIHTYSKPHPGHGDTQIRLEIGEPILPTNTGDPAEDALTLVRHWQSAVLGLQRKVRLEMETEAIDDQHNT